MTEATTGTLTVSVVDYKGEPATVKIGKVPNKYVTLKNAEKVANYLKKYCNARISGYGASKGVQDDDTSTGKYDRVLQKLRLIFKDHKANATRTFSIPAPKDTAVTDDQEPHSDIPEDVRDLMKEIGAISEKDEMEYLGGGLVSRVGRAGSRNTKTTGI